MMQRFPWAHRAGMSFIGRFVDDLDAATQVARQHAKHLGV